MERKIGAQTIVWGEDIRENMEQILEFLAEQGYRGVETGMRHFDATSPGHYRKLYDKTGIALLGIHSGGKFWDPEQAAQEIRKLGDTAAFAADAGARHLVVSGNPAETVESMKQSAETYRTISRRCREAGIRFAYHNHNWELKDDAAVLDALVSRTTPEELSLVLDTAWAHLAGMNLETLLKRYAARVAYLHIKDVRGERFCELGTGELDLERILNLAEKYGIEWLVVEQDYTDRTADESMKMNMDFLKEQGVVSP